ncbi:MAG TPA: YncE family protein [Puia sp.]|jgi:YVTN family beta-propeller protein|nr:YncE family protein [Puia sp.]
MKKLSVFIRVLGLIIMTICMMPGNLLAQAGSGFKVAKVFHIASSGGWDYIAVGPDNNRLYVSHGTQVNVLNETTGDSVGVIPNTTGVHGIAFVPAFGKGYTSNGRLNNITVFDLKSNQVLSLITAGTNPDAIMYDDFSKLIITCNGRSNDLSLIDPSTEKLVATIPVGGKPETAVSDGKGKIFVNIEDKNEIISVDINSRTVLNHWPLAPTEGPTGLAIDLKNNRLFAGCEKTLVVLDATTGKVISRVIIGNGCDGVVFDPALGFAFASCGEGVLSIVHETSNGEYALLENVPTKASARTSAINPKTHTVYLPAAEFQKNSTPGTRPPLVPGTFQVLVVKR